MKPINLNFTSKCCLRTLLFKGNLHNKISKTLKPHATIIYSVVECITNQYQNAVTIDEAN